MGKTTKATLVFLVLFIGTVVYLSTRIAAFECKVCVTYSGETICRTTFPTVGSTTSWASPNRA